MGWKCGNGLVRKMFLPNFLINHFSILLLLLFGDCCYFWVWPVVASVALCHFLKNMLFSKFSSLQKANFLKINLDICSHCWDLYLHPWRWQVFNWEVTIAQWIRPSLPSCYPWFESQAHHPCFYIVNFELYLALY